MMVALIDGLVKQWWRYYDRIPCYSTGQIQTARSCHASHTSFPDPVPHPSPNRNPPSGYPGRAPGDRRARRVASSMEIYAGPAAGWTRPAARPDPRTSVGPGFADRPGLLQPVRTSPAGEIRVTLEDIYTIAGSSALNVLESGGPAPPATCRIWLISRG